MRLAANQYNDATAFIAVMEFNNLADYLINEPVLVNTLAPATRGSQSLLLPATTGIGLGDFVYCDGFNTYGIVIGVTQNYSVPTTPYCDCPSGTSSDHILPPQGTVISTTVLVSQVLDSFNQVTAGLDNDLVVGSQVTFSVSDQTTINFPTPLTSTNGIMN